MILTLPQTGQKWINNYYAIFIAEIHGKMITKNWISGNIYTHDINDIYNRFIEYGWKLLK